MCLLLLPGNTLLYGSDDGNGKNITDALPDQYSFLIYGQSLDKAFKEFKDSYFWQKYKLTRNGKELDRNLDSLNASFLVIGLVLDDLLQILSGQAVLAVWLKNSSVDQYLYLIEKKENKSKLNSLVERLEYFAYANKIDLKKTPLGDYTVYDFNNKVFLADSASCLLISSDERKIEQSVKRLENGSRKKNGLDFNAYFKNRNLITYLKMTNEVKKRNEDHYYSFRFSGKPRVEGLFRSPDSIRSNSGIPAGSFYYLPSVINMACSLQETGIREYMYPFFDTVDTNIFKLDKGYFSAFFDRTREYNNVRGLCGMQLNSKATNFIMIVSTNSQERDFYQSFATRTNEPGINETWNNKVRLYRAGDYFCFQNGYLLISNSLSFLKRGLDACSKRNGFYYTQEFTKIRNMVSRDLFLWMDLKEYVTARALKNGDDKWYYYNAYIKTFGNLYLSGERKEDYFYLNLTF
ncbi:MAG: hypothetical protein PHF84_03810 [bacterium]|nr:hypothetical protein [bacterium]